MIDNDSTTLDYSDHHRRTHVDSEAYDQLLKEKTNLENNFQEAIKLSEQVNGLHTENDKLRKVVTELNRDNEDLKQRLQLSVQANQDLRDQLEVEKKNSNSVRGADLTSMNKKIESVKKQSKQQMDEIYDQLEQAKSELDRESLEKRHLMNQINNILEESRRYFNVQFNSGDELIKHLQTAPLSTEFTLPTTVTQSNTTIANQSKQQDQQLQKKVKKLKKQIKEEQEKQAAQEEEIHKLKSEIKTLQAQQESEVRQLNDQIENLESNNKKLSQDNQNLRAAHNQQVDEFENLLQKKNNENKTLKQKNKAMKTEIRNQRLGLAARGNFDDHRSNSSKSSESSTASSPSSNGRYVQRQVEVVHAEPVDNSLVERVTELTEQLSQARSKRDEFQSKLREAEERNNAAAVELNKVHTENETLRKLYETVKEERESFREILAKKAETAKEIQEKQKNAAKQPNARVLKLQKALDQEKQKVYTLQCNETKLQSKVDDLESALRLLQQSTNDAKEEAKKANAELTDVRRQSEIQTTQTPEDLLPPSAYNYDEFDAPLLSAIRKIGSNNALQPVSKIQNCFKTIRKYYEKQLAERDEALDQAFSENQSLSSAFNQFFEDASITLCDQAYTLQDFFSNNAGQKFVEQVGQLRTNYADLKHQNEIQRGWINAFTNTFVEYVTEPVDPLRAIGEIKDKLDQQQTQVTARSKKIKDLKAQVKNQQGQLKKQDQDLEREKESLGIQKKELESRLAVLNKTVTELREKNENLTTELDIANRTIEETQMNLSQEQDDHNTTMLEDAAKTEASLRSEIKKRNAEIKSLKAQVQEHQKTINGLKSQIQTLTNDKRLLQDEIAEGKRQVEEVDRQAAQRLEAEKRNIIQSYDVAIDELKEQCNKHRKDVERMAAEASEYELRIASCNNDIAVVKKEKRKLENDLVSMKGQLEREKKLMETKIRAEKVQAESNYNSKLEEQKARAEAEKRKLFALGAEAFRNFFNPNEQIDERSFKSLLEKVRNTIVQLQKSDADIRRMLGAAETQTTQDAVAQLMMSNK